MTTAITPHDVASYQDQGYLVVPNVLTQSELDAVKAELAELIDKASGVTENDVVYDLEDSHTQAAPRVRRIKEPHTVMPSVAALVRHPEMVEILSRLIGPGVRFQSSKLNMKSAGDGSAVEWHQDWAFYPHTNDDVLAVGVMLDAMTEDNGPLLCIPGTHKGPTYDHHQDGHFVGAIDPDTSGIDFSKAEKITGKAGSCSFHHVRMMHGSGQNTSGKDRRLLLLQVAAADAWDIRGMSRIGSWEQYEATMIAGTVTNVPRVVPAPIRLPFPEPLKKGSIYESQSLVKNKYFGAKSAAE